MARKAAKVQHLNSQTFLLNLFRFAESDQVSIDGYASTIIDGITVTYELKRLKFDGRNTTFSASITWDKTLPRNVLRPDQLFFYYCNTRTTAKPVKILEISIGEKGIKTVRLKVKGFASTQNIKFKFSGFKQGKKQG